MKETSNQSFFTDLLNSMNRCSMATNTGSNNEQIVVKFGGTSIAGESSRDFPPGSGASGDVKSVGMRAPEGWKSEGLAPEAAKTEIDGGEINGGIWSKRGEWRGGDWEGDRGLHFEIDMAEELKGEWRNLRKMVWRREIWRREWEMVLDEQLERVSLEESVESGRI